MLLSISETKIAWLLVISSIIIINSIIFFGYANMWSMVITILIFLILGMFVEEDFSFFMVFINLIAIFVITILQPEVQYSKDISKDKIYTIEQYIPNDSKLLVRNDNIPHIFTLSPEKYWEYKSKNCTELQETEYTFNPIVKYGYESYRTPYTEIEYTCKD